MDGESRLADFLREVSNWDWEQFCLAEHDAKYTSNEALIFALVRACAMEKLDAIKLALNRLDGKLKTPVRVEYPKVFVVYPHASLPAGDATSSALPASTPHIASGTLVPTTPPATEDEKPLTELSLRQTLKRMSDHPRQVPEAVIEYAVATQQWLNHQAEEPEEKPLVKSVLAAHLLQLAQSRNTVALEEVFNQVDGKLVETIQLLGDDLYITSYATTAPPDAQLNEHGVLQVEATAAQNMWAERLAQLNGA